MPTKYAKDPVISVKILGGITIKSTERLMLTKKMRAIRKALGMSQTQLTEAMDCSNQTIHNYVNAKRSIAPAILKSLFNIIFSKKNL